MIDLYDEEGSVDSNDNSNNEEYYQSFIYNYNYNPNEKKIKKNCEWVGARVFWITGIPVVWRTKAPIYLDINYVLNVQS